MQKWNHCDIVGVGTGFFFTVFISWLVFLSSDFQGDCLHFGSACVTNNRAPISFDFNYNFAAPTNGGSKT